MKDIHTLIEDMYAVAEHGADVSDEVCDQFGKRMAELLKQRFAKENREGRPYLRLSSVGTHCDRKLWLTINHPETSEPLDGQTRLKFFVGDVWEEVLLTLAKIAGHSVEGEQDVLEVNGIKGHRDAVIDGVTVDVKSASPFAFDKFAAGLNPASDDFGYLDQLGSYVAAGQDDPLVEFKNTGAFLAVDKVTGRLCLDRHDFPDASKIYNKIERKKEAVAADRMPSRGYDDEPDGKSGNRKLGTACSYCSVKDTCWPGLRTFLYKSGSGFKPRFLTEVKKTPDVPEAK